MGFNISPFGLVSKIKTESRPCPACKGHGYIRLQTSNTSRTNAEMLQYNIVCPSCGGIGLVTDFVVTAGRDDKS